MDSRCDEVNVSPDVFRKRIGLAAYRKSDTTYVNGMKRYAARTNFLAAKGVCVDEIFRFQKGFSLRNVYSDADPSLAK